MEVDYLMKLIRKGDDASLSILEKIRAAPWKAKPPNVRQTINKCEERDDPWEDIPQEDCASEMSEDISPPRTDSPQEDPYSPPRPQLLRRRGDLPNWEDLIGSSLEELKMAHPGQYEGAGLTPQDPENPPRPGAVNTQEVSKLMHTLHYDPEGRQATTAYFEALSRTQDYTKHRRGGSRNGATARLDTPTQHHHRQQQCQEKGDSNNAEPRPIGHFQVNACDSGHTGHGTPYFLLPRYLDTWTRH